MRYVHVVVSQGNKFPHDALYIWVFSRILKYTHCATKLEPNFGTQSTIFSYLFRPSTVQKLVRKDCLNTWYQWYSSVFWWIYPNSLNLMLRNAKYPCYPQGTIWVKMVQCMPMVHSWKISQWMMLNLNTVISSKYLIWGKIHIIPLIIPIGPGSLYLV